MDDLAPPVRFFPTPYPDESLYSLAYRIGQCNGLKQGHLLQRLFGTRHAIASSLLPSHLGQFARHVPPLIATDGATWAVNTLTTFRYFSAFLDPTKSNAVARAMQSREGGRIHAILGTLAGRVGACAPLRWCPLCLQDDFRRSGAPYWHRSHQLPNVFVCHIHGTILVEGLSVANSRARHELMAPGVGECQGNGYRGQRISSATSLDAALRFARWSHDLLNRTSGPWPRRDLRERLTGELFNQAWAHATGRIRLSDMTSAFIAHHQELAYLREPNLLPDDVNALPWLAKLLRKPRSDSHPVKHILLHQFLFKNWDAFLAVADAALPCQPQGPSESTPIAITESLPVLLSQGMTLTAAARCLGVTTTTARVQAEALGIPVNTRPKRLRPDVLSNILRSLQDGATLPAAAVSAGVSLTTIYRVQRAHPEIANTRRIAAFDREREARRAHFIDLVENVRPRGNPALSADGTWLRRNDEAWFRQHSTTHMKSLTPPKSPVDWPRRDQAFLEQIEAHVEATISGPSKPVRITKARVARELGHPAWAAPNKMALLPRSHERLAQLEETEEVFQVRRIGWAARALTQAHAPLAAWRIVRRANIRPSRLTPAASAKIHALSQLSA